MIVAAICATIAAIQVPTPTLVGTVPLDEMEQSPGLQPMNYRMSWSPSGTLCAITVGNGKIAIWPSLQRLEVSPGGIPKDLIWSTDGEYLGVTDGNGFATCLYNVRSRKVVMRAPVSALYRDKSHGTLTTVDVGSAVAHVLDDEQYEVRGQERADVLTSTTDGSLFIFGLRSAEEDVVTYFVGGPDLVRESELGRKPIYYQLLSGAGELLPAGWSILGIDDGSFYYTYGKSWAAPDLRALVFAKYTGSDLESEQVYVSGWPRDETSFSEDVVKLGKRLFSIAFAFGDSGENRPRTLVEIRAGQAFPVQSLNARPLALTVRGSELIYLTRNTESLEIWSIVMRDDAH